MRKIITKLIVLASLMVTVSAVHADEQAAKTEVKKVVKLKVGEKAPNFTLLNQAGKKVSLSDYAGKKSVVLCFNRAHW